MIMKKFLLGLIALIVLTLPLKAQQLNLGVAGRRLSETPVVDVVLMQKVNTIYVYGQATVTNTNKKPELSLALELPMIDKNHFYLGFDEGGSVGVTEDNKFAKGKLLFGLTSWMAVQKNWGIYWMVSTVAPSETVSTTVQAGVFITAFKK